MNNKKKNYFWQIQCMKKFLLLPLVFSLFLCINPTVCAADTVIEEQYAPIFYFESEEQCYPVEVEYLNMHISLNEFTGSDTQKISDSISIESLGTYSSDQYQYYFIDNLLGTIKDDNIIKHYSNNKDSFGYTVYSRSIPQDDITILQYWMFYAFNKGDLNQHEGDWELVQIILKDNKPIQVMYSQHHNGQIATWDQVDKTGTNPHVYVARGSHANYFRSYSGMIGISSDHVGSNGMVLKPSQYDLITLKNQSWLDFRGLWGEVSSIEDFALGQNGPHGPKYREEGIMWNEPQQWGANLQPLNSTMLIVEFFLYYFIQIFILILILSLAIFAWKKIKQYKETGFGPRVFSLFYIDGLNLNSIGNILFILGIIIAIFSLTSPWYSVSASFDGQTYSTEGLIDIIIIDGLQGVSVTIPGADGPMPLGSAVIPFSILIGIGIILTLVKTLGVQQSKTLGKSYIHQGIKLILPVIFIIIAIMAIAGIATSMIPTGVDTSGMTQIFNDLSASPFGGSSIQTFEASGDNIYLHWGIQSGGILLLLSGIICLIGGILLRKQKKEFF